MILNKIRSWNKLSILGISLMLLNNISCIDYEDNVNPNEVTEEMMEADNLKTGAFFSQMLRRVVIVNDGDKLDSDYQIAQNLSHDLYSGYIAATLGSTNHNGQYNFQEQWVNATFDYAYTGIMAPWQSIHKIATEQELPEVDALATIVKVEGMHRIADTFGPIPYVNYGSSSLYDALDLVYNKFFEELDNAIEVLSNYVNGNVDAKLMSDYDCVYGGDVEKWVKFANTLRLRLALRVSNVDPALAQTQAKAALTDPAGLMQSQDDNMKQTPKRQYIAGGNENIYALLFSWTGNAVLSKEMERAYKNQALKEGAAADAVTFNENSENCYLDPRCEVLWFRPTPFDSLTTSPLPTENLKKDFNGVMNGETNVGGSYLNRYSANRCILSSDAMNKDYWWNLAREIVWMGYAESLFLKAEAALRWPSLVDETAEALYLKGIKASMDYYEIDADKANEYISHLDGVKAFAGSSKEEQLEQIITQKWIAVFPNGNEGWAEVRRTDYPRYLLAPVNGNNSNGEVASGKLIKRINYPNSESRNPNKPGNVNQGSRVWWDVADTMNDRGQWHTPNNFR